MCSAKKEISLETILENNKAWVKAKTGVDPEYFSNLAVGQKPPFLWIGCSDSRIPANEVTGMKAGEVFVHRNIANQVVYNDMNLLSVLDYAVNVLGVKHIILCGHYGCGGVEAAYRGNTSGIIHNWLAGLRGVYYNNKEELDAIADEKQRHKQFVKLNVAQQVLNLTETSIIKNAWETGMEVQLHGFIYDIETGYLIDTECPLSGISGPESINIKAG